MSVRTQVSINICYMQEHHTIELCTMDDYSQITKDIVDFWGSDRTLSLHHSMFIYEFGNTAFVVREGNRVIGYLFGFLSQTSETGYVHLLGVRESAQRKGMGHLLYHHFINYLRPIGYKKVKAMTTPGNSKSISFHQKLGMTLLGEKNFEGIEVMKNYSGPGQDRVVFEMEI